MAILATKIGPGTFGVPPLGVFHPGETREVPQEVAVWLSKYKDEFRIEYTDTADLAHRGPDGKVRYVGFRGPIDTRFGYGGGGALVLRALARVGIETSVGNQYVHLPDLHPEAAGQVLSRKYLPKVEITHSTPEQYPPSEAAIRVAWTMWESDRIPDHDGHSMKNWVTLLNQVDHLVVPCQHNAEVFRDSGVTVPTTVIPYGIDPEPWPYVDRPERDTFTVIQFGDLSARKGPEEALEAFQLAFPKERDVRIIFKTLWGKFGHAPGLIPQFRDPRVQVIDGAWPRSQLLDFMTAADCFIWLSRGEGFGLPPAQAALTGLPVVMTTHTGMAEYYDPKFFYGVGCPTMSESPLGGRWYEPSVEEAAAQLRKVYENRKEAKRRGKAASTYIRKRLTLDRMGQQIQTLLETF